MFAFVVSKPCDPSINVNIRIILMSFGFFSSLLITNIFMLAHFLKNKFIFI